MENLNVLTISDYRGGIIEQGRKGPYGSFKFGYGLDIRSGENTLKCQQALKKDSGSVVVDLPLVIIKGSDGYKYAFGDAGNIYRKKTTTWEKVYTDGDGRISGAVEYTSTSGTYILYATPSNVKKITLANAGTQSDWTSYLTTVGAFTNGSTEDWHTGWEGIGVVFFMDGDRIFEYDYADAYNANALRLPTHQGAKTIRDRNDRIVMCTGLGYLFQWDRLADSWFGKKDSQAGVVNAFEWFEGGALAQVGQKGNVKFWNLNEFYPFRRIPGTQTSYPGATCIHNEIIHMGMNGGAKNGVYAIGRFDQNDPISINLEYIPSHGKLTGTEIGALCSDGDDIYVGWKDGTDYGIDVTDQDNKASAIYESLRLNMSKEQMDKLVSIVKIEMLSLPDGCSVTVKFKSTTLTGNEDADGWNQAELEGGDTSVDTAGATEGIFQAGAQGETYEVRVELTPNGNDTPEILSINNYFSFLNAL